MQHHVIVSFGREKEFEFKFAGGASVEDARKWFDHEFTVLECDVHYPDRQRYLPSTVSSVLPNMPVRAVFADQHTWAEQFAKYTAALLGRELIRVDVEHYSIGY
jgi:hypothetical protein